jgi:FemAB-related protein (PEP-CTERM system-associated)
VNAAAPLTVAIRAADLADVGERARLDAFVAGHPEGTLFHRPQWSRAVERGCRQRAHYLLAERQGALVGCLPLTELRSRLFGDALVSVGFATGGGILAESEAAAAALAEAGWVLAQRLGCNSVELRGGPWPEPWTRQQGIYANFSRPVSGDADALLASIPRRQRAEIRRSLGFGLEVSCGTDRRHRDAHYRIYAESVRNLGTPVFPRALFEAALDEFGDEAWIVLIAREGRPLAALLGFDWKGAVQPYWGGGTVEAKTWRANDLIYFETMRLGVERGCTCADFGRSKVGSGPWARKRIWGFEETPLVYAVRTAGGKAPREVNPQSPRYRLQVAAWQRLPLWLANRLGPPIARGLG